MLIQRRLLSLESKFCLLLLEDWAMPDWSSNHCNNPGWWEPLKKKKNQMFCFVQWLEDGLMSNYTGKICYLPVSKLDGHTWSQGLITIQFGRECCSGFLRDVFMVLLGTDCTEDRVISTILKWTWSWTLLKAYWHRNVWIRHDVECLWALNFVLTVIILAASET